ncbi:MAG: FBP domain-containing protein [Clostridia bacterium]|nr:FBP domain-containing protein [Deltaproteobacteria bacterium]
MFKVDNEAELLAAFRPKDRELIELTPGTKFPVIVRGYHAWQHPAGGRVFVLFAVADGAPTGIVFDSNGAGPHVPHMCDWCHSLGPGAHAGLLTAYVNSRKRAGIHVCSDLSCKQKLEEEADRTGRSAHVGIDKVVQRMAKFAHDVLGIDLSGANR